MYQQLESGSGNPTLETLTKIATALRITVDRILRLDHLPLKDDESTFCSRFKECFDAVRFGVGMRTTRGNILYANQFLSQVNAIEQMDLANGSGTVNLFQVLTGAAKETMRNQLNSETRGFVAPYLIYLDMPNGERSFLRCYPTVLYPAKGEHGNLVTIYATSPERDCQEHYFDYCQLLLKSAARIA